MATSAQQIADLQRENNQMYREVAQAQMDFQREMSNTAHVRETKDLIAAGLNPVLSAGAQGASTPNGAQAEVDAQSMVSYLINEMNNENAARMNSAQVAAQRYAAEMSLKAAQVAANAQIEAAQLNNMNSWPGFIGTALSHPNSPQARAVEQFFNIIGLDWDSIVNGVRSGIKSAVNGDKVDTGYKGVKVNTNTGEIDLSSVFGNSVYNPGRSQNWVDKTCKAIMKVFPKTRASEFIYMVNKIGLWKYKGLQEVLRQYYHKMNFHIPKYYQ